MVFDCDGTLVDSEPIHAKAISFVLGEYGLDISAAAIMSRFTGCDNAHLLEKIGTESGIKWPEDIDQQLDDSCLRLLLLEARAMPGAVAALDACRAAELGLAVASNSKRPLVAAMLGCTRLGSYFDDRLATRDRVNAGKPAPDCYLVAAAFCGVPASRCLAIEDSPAGVQAARAAGMTALGYRPAGSTISAEVLRAVGAAGVIDDLRQLVQLLEGRPFAALIH